MFPKPDHEAAFAQFWASFPRREKKQAARDWFRWAMQNHNQDGQLLTRILATLAWQIKRNPDPTFWQQPDKWLKGMRWEDEPPAVRVRVTTESAEDVALRKADRARVEAEQEARWAAIREQQAREAAEKQAKQRAAEEAEAARILAFRESRKRTA